MPLQVFRVCQFTAIGGRVDVKYTDWGLAARLPDRQSFAIVAIMLHQYVVECPPIGCHLETTVVPKKLNPKHIDELLTDLAPVAQMDTALRRWLSTYDPPDNDKHKEKLSEVITLRAHLFSDAGKLLLKIGSIFADLLAKKKVAAASSGGDSTKINLTLEERAEGLASRSLNFEHELYKIEKKFREGLMKTTIYDTINPLQPNFLYPIVIKPTVKEKAPPEPAKPRALPSAAFSSTGEAGARSHEQLQEDEAALYTRLQISGLLSKVLLRPGASIKAFHLVTVDAEGPSEATPNRRTRYRSEARRRHGRGSEGFGSAGSQPCMQ